MNNVSIPPAGITWPMVAFALVRELPYLAMTLGGAVVSISLIMHGDGSSLERLGAVIVPAVISALAKSKPGDGAAAGGVASLALFLIAKKFGA